MWVALSLLGMALGNIAFSQLSSVPLAIGAGLLINFMNAPSYIGRQLLIEGIRLCESVGYYVSRQILRDYGNMSSPTILFVLDAIQRSGQVRPGDYGVLLGFGPGLTIEGALVQW